MNETGIKHDKGKPRMELIPREGLIQLSRVLEFGANKYDDHNWRKGMAWSKLIGATLRHLHAFNDGIDTDDESGISHIAHAVCNLMFLLEYIKVYPQLDDRYKTPIIKNEHSE